MLRGQGLDASYNAEQGGPRDMHLSLMRALQSRLYSKEGGEKRTTDHYTRRCSSLARSAKWWFWWRFLLRVIQMLSAATHTLALLFPGLRDPHYLLFDLP